MPVVELVVRALLLVVFASAVLGKVCSAAAFGDFRDSVAALTRPDRWAPAAADRLTTWTAALVVLGEAAVVVVLLAVPAARPVGHLLAALLLGTFAVAIAATVGRGQAVRCRCFGTAGALLGRGHVVRNGLLGALAALCAFAGAGRAGPSATLLALVGGALLGLVVTRWDDLVFLVTARTAPTGPGDRR